MKRIGQAFKNLYKGENVVNRHLMFTSLLVLPAIAGGFVGYIDKETPTVITAVCALFSVIFLILAIIPGIFNLGFFYSFCNDRLNDKIGVPEINSETFVRGLKSLPLVFVWSIYTFLFVAVVFVLPIILCIYSMVASHSNPLAVFGGIVMFSLWLLIFLVICFILSPFTGFIKLKYSEKFEYSVELFNPLILIEFMRKSFKPAIIIALKFIVVNCITGTVASMLGALPGLVIMLIVAGSILFGTSGDNSVYAPEVMLPVIVLTALGGIIQMYISSMTAYAYNDNIVDVYKEKIQ